MPADTPQIVGLKEWMERSGVPHKVTSTWRPADTRSHHSAGLAVDFAGPVPSWDSKALEAIYKALRALGPQALELIYSGPGGGFWKNGEVVHAYAEDAHHNHVHIAMPTSWPYNPPEETTVQPVVPVANAPFAAILVHPDGGYLEIGEDGGVFAWGGAPFYGSLGGTHLNQPIVDAQWAPDHAGYYLLGRDGGIFAFGSAAHQGNALWTP